MTTNHPFCIDCKCHGCIHPTCIKPHCNRISCSQPELSCTSGQYNSGGKYADAEAPDNVSTNPSPNHLIYKEDHS